MKLSSNMIIQKKKFYWILIFIKFIMSKISKHKSILKLKIKSRKLAEASFISMTTKGV